LPPGANPTRQHHQLRLPHHHRGRAHATGPQQGSSPRFAPVQTRRTPPFRIASKAPAQIRHPHIPGGGAQVPKNWIEGGIATNFPLSLSYGNSPGSILINLGQRQRCRESSTAHVGRLVVCCKRSTILEWSVS